MDARIVVVEESVGEHGGTERVVEAALSVFPGARRVTVAATRRRHFTVPFVARGFADAASAGADVVLSFPTSGAALGAPVPDGARHVAYFPGPPRALHGHTAHYLLEYPVAVRPAVALAVPALRAFARRLAALPDRLLTISRASADGFERLYGLRAEVVPPPIRTDFLTPADRDRTHFLAVSRLVPHKRVDRLVDAFRGLDAELVVAGTGPWLDRFRATAPPNVRFAGFVPDSELRELYRSAHALVSPTVEEFGMAMAEAHACGTPVIAPRAGGALDIVDDGVTGWLVDDPDPGSIRSAVRQVTDCYKVDPERCRASAERFSEERFAASLVRVVEQELSLVRSAPRPSAAPRTASPELAAAPLSRR